MKRRTFIKGAVSVAVAASLPGAAEYTYKTFRTARQWDWDGKTMTTLLPVNHEMSERMIAALCRSMSQTRERVAADVFNRAFGE